MKCQYEGCKRYAWEKDTEGLCIFHSTRVDMKTDDFREAWTLFLNKRGREDGSFNHIICIGFVFPGTLSLAKFSFPEGANFQGARFSGSAHFEEAQFGGHAYFEGTRFLGDARFERVLFGNIAHFEDAHFHGNALFEGARFERSAHFQRSHFREGSRFLGARFDGNADFQESVHAKGAQFIGVSISKKADFGHARGGPIQFDRANLDGADFRDCSLSNLHLTHITKHDGAMFGPTDVDNVNWTGSDLFKKRVMDQNYLHDFRTRNGFNRYFLYPLWKITSNCGRSFGLWAAWSLMIVLVFGILYASKGAEWFLEASGWDTFTPFYYSTVTFATLGFGKITPHLNSGTARFTYFFEVALGYAMLAGLISIFVKKMSRARDW